ncbi:MAG TPA: alpha/beta hydrolase [Xanthobacteraceae bacterium]|jgi:pimeloyl-ACP methyl ester carboxylesterase
MLPVSEALVETSDFVARRVVDVGLQDGAVVRLRVYGRGPRLVVSHGNGLAIEAYRPFWSLFVDRHEVVVFDFRHHGLSTPYQGPMQNWPRFIADFGVVLAAIERELGAADTVGVFHSMSAVTALLHASEHDTPWRGLLAFEPPTPPPSGHPEFEPFFDLHRDLAESAARRRPAFAAVEDLATSFARTSSFRRMGPEALQRLAAATLRWNAVKGHYELACAREFESETFRLRHLEDAWARTTSVSLPVCILAGIPDPDENRCLSNVARSLALNGGFAFQSVPDATHFLQLERPRECAAIVDAFVARVLSTKGHDHV